MDLAFVGFGSISEFKMPISQYWIYDANDLSVARVIFSAPDFKLNQKHIATIPIGSEKTGYIKFSTEAPFELNRGRSFDVYWEDGLVGYVGIHPSESGWISQGTRRDDLWFPIMGGMADYENIRAGTGKLETRPIVGKVIPDNLTSIESNIRNQYLIDWYNGPYYEGSDPKYEKYKGTDPREEWISDEIKLIVTYHCLIAGTSAWVLGLLHKKTDSS